MSWWLHSSPHLVFSNYRFCIYRLVTEQTVIVTSSTNLLPIYLVIAVAWFTVSGHVVLTNHFSGQTKRALCMLISYSNNRSVVRHMAY